ncbi:MAG: Na+/H+ antiporter NhaC family protein [Candidatus Krumholzibacteria bacterium]|nr:Na+/H+ antiporter NhaC family protein [Candidatus Krumholzibacteria bacterium]
MRSQPIKTGILMTLAAAVLVSTSVDAFADRLPRLQLKGVPFHFYPDAETIANAEDIRDTVTVSIENNVVFEGTVSTLASDGVKLVFDDTGIQNVRISGLKTPTVLRFRIIHGALALLPPIIAIVIALAFKQVVIALLAGVWLGSLVVTGFHPVISITRIVDHYVINTLAGPEEGADHMSILIFTLLLGGMVGITSRMGGMQGIVARVSKLATDARRGQFTVWLMGVIIFFDDYTNTLIVGNSMRPLTDRLRISREKLSYIVDSTAAPITSLAVITSWIGFQISLINQSFISMGVERNPLTTFVSSLPYSLYPILAILFVLLIILSRRDYSSMLRAERRARSTGKVNSDDAVPLSSLDSDAISLAKGVTPRLINGILPIGAVIAITFAGLLITGRSSLIDSGVESFGIFEMLKESNSFVALLWSSFAGCVVAAILALVQRLLNVRETVEAWVNGIKSMVTAFVILVLAWCIGKVCVELHTAEFLVHHLAGILSPRFLPMLIFLLAIGISFSTGTSWGTMSILTPIVIPLVYGTASAAGLTASEMEPVLLASIASILSGAVFGDHCSPISDTTIMSSMASGADHIDHVRTQLPYALTVGAVSLVCGYLLTALGLPAPLSILVSIAILVLIVYLCGKRSEGHA